MIPVVVHSDARAAHKFLLRNRAGEYSGIYKRFYSILGGDTPLEMFNEYGTHRLTREYKSFYGTPYFEDSGFRIVWRIFSRGALSYRDWVTLICKESDIESMSTLYRIIPEEATLVVVIREAAVNYHKSRADGNEKRKHDYREFIPWWQEYGRVHGRAMDSR